MTSSVSKAFDAWMESERRHDEEREQTHDREYRMALIAAELRRTLADTDRAGLVEDVVAKHGLRLDWDYADHLLYRERDAG
jgi:hypothetical protein